MVHPKAELFVIESAYKRLAREYHPDLSKATDTNEKMIDINEAYYVLSDTQRRKEFDDEYHRQSYRETSRNSENNSKSDPFADEQTGYAQSNHSSDVTIDDLIRKACALIRGNNYPPAIALLKRAVDLNPYDRRTEMMLRDAKRTWGQILLRQNY